ncbi:hypothetical protein CLV56_3072 [Mumia flava]|uniref:Uncharacterized protein n=1 Tax=Mumia flava TaxID=1348852 RepID=A0A0B2B4P4_9ACTN|nr:hypothetical protein [Mumia flava]PJJ53582.1 hypothetical protein CLV56_3072 [Mumia flava]
MSGPITLPDGQPLPSTRAELLEARHAALAGLSPRVASVRAGLAQLGWSLLGAAAAGLLAAGLGDGASAWVRILLVGAAVALGAIASGGLVTVLRGRAQDRRAARAWSVADRTEPARALAPGPIDTELRTPYDARDDPDLDRVASGAATAAHAGLYRFSVLELTLLVPAGLVLGLVAALAALSGVDSPATSAAAAAAAAFLLVPAAVTGVLLTREAGMRQRLATLVSLENQVLRARRAVITAAEPPSPVRPVLPGAFVVVVVVLGLAVLAIRIASSSPPALVVTLAVLAALGLLAAVRLVRARRLHLVPLLSGDGRTIPPARGPAVSVAQDGGPVIVRTRDGRVLLELPPGAATDAVVLGRTRGPFVGVVALGTVDEPVVLAGSGVERHPVLSALVQPR